MPDLPSRFFSDEHDRLRALFAASAPGQAAVDLPSFDAFRRALVRHLAIEERVVMPALSAHLGAAFEATRRKLRQDHSALVALVVPTPNEDWLQDLREILEHHCVVEEGPDGLGALADRHLGGELDALLEAAQRLPEVVLGPFEDGAGAQVTLRRVLTELGLVDPRGTSK